MKEDIIELKSHWQESALVNEAHFSSLYDESINNPDQFWHKMGERLHWFKKWDKVSDWSFAKPIRVNWYLGGKLNVSYNCIDRHLPKHANTVAIIWEPENLKEKTQYITYQQLHESVCQWSNLLTQQGVQSGDRVTIYLPMIPEAAYAMLACARIGAVHSVIFAGFSPQSIVDRVQDCDSEFIITADVAVRGGKTLALKENVDEAMKNCPQVKKIFVAQRFSDQPIVKKDSREVDVNQLLPAMNKNFPAKEMDSESPLFILYTSGSTNKPKGVLHTSGGYLTYASLTHELVFNYRASQIYWCAADIGWVTGHSYILYGPLSNAATTIMYEGLPTYPTHSRIWEIVDKHKVEILYTAPTLIRALMREGESFVKSTSRKSLKILGSVGEPINPEAWRWYYELVGNSQCPVVDTWWQTETGGILITPLPGVRKLKPGSATKAFLGIEPVMLNEKGQEMTGAGSGYLALKRSWPGQMRGVYKDPERFYSTYFSQYPGYYFTGDGCRRDEDDYYWITGRVDDVLNVSGHRLGTAEIESALVEHVAVAEAAVVGFPHDIKGEGIYAFVTLCEGHKADQHLKSDLVEMVRKIIGPIAKPDHIQWAPALPKTRSGKIMRRILRKIASNDTTNLGDTTTLADPNVVQQLIDNRLS